MNRPRRLLLFAFLILMLSPSLVLYAQSRAIGVKARGSSAEGPRVALVIGNSAYTNIAALRNPVNDARGMGKVLRESGFDVTVLLNGDRRRMLKAVNNFGNKLRKGGVGLFYYAGHGVQAQGRNYLIPLKAQVEGQADLEFEAVDAGRVLAKMENAQNKLNIVVLDACRNNPFKSNFRSANSGLAQVSAPAGSLVAFATSPGKVAADGTGRNGLYTEQLIRHMRTPGIKLEEVFKRVRGDVYRISRQMQVPWENTSVTGDFYFRKGSTAAAVVVKQEPKVTGNVLKTLNEQEEFWKIIRDSKNIRDFQDFLKTYPEGRFAILAKVKIRQLQTQPAGRTSAAVVSPLAPLVAPALIKGVTARPLLTYKGHTNTIYALAFSPDSTTALSGSRDYYMKLWNLSSGATIRTMGHDDYVKSVAFSPDGRQAFSASEDRHTRIWNLSTGKIVKNYKFHRKAIKSMALSSDGKMAVSGGNDLTVTIWNTGTGKVLHSMTGHTNRIYAVAFSPDGTTVLSAGKDLGVRLWNVKTGALLKVLLGHTRFVNSVVYSPDGQFAITGADDRTIKVWSLQSGIQVRSFNGHARQVLGLAMSRDGQILVSGSADKTAKLWDFSTGRLLTTLTGHSNRVHAVAISPDGKRVMTGSADETVKVWEITLLN